MRIILTCFLLSLPFIQLAQYNPDRYKDQIFTTASGETDVKYGKAPQWVWPYWEEDLKLNVYRPDGDTLTKRPLIIFAHAGGFLNGSKDVDNMLAICDSFARKGYVTATIDYRKGFNPLDGSSAERAVYRGIQDGKAAVRFFKEKRDTYGIDTNNIFFGGMSAGGYIALHVGYMDKESERPQSTYGGGTVNNLGCLDCSGNNYAHSSKVKGVLDYWGAVQDTTIIETGDAPVLIMHGENDPTVPFGVGHPFGLSTLPSTYGGSPVSTRARNLGLDYEFYTSTGNLHMLDGSDNGTFTNPPNSFWSDTLLPRTTDFLYRLIKPETIRVSPEIITVCKGEVFNLDVLHTAGNYYVWSYGTGVPSVTDLNTSRLSVSYAQPGDYVISVYEYNRIMCAGIPITFTIRVEEPAVADFSYAVNGMTVDFSNLSAQATAYNWNFGDGSTSTQTTPSHTYSAPGTYDVKLIAEGNCNDTIVKQVIIESLAVEVLSEQLAKVYPNPVGDQFVISAASGNQFSYSITDALGRIIKEGDLNAEIGTVQVDASLWSKGNYFVILQQAETGNRYTVKLIK